MEYVVTGYGKRYLKTDVTFDNLCSMARCQDGGGGEEMGVMKSMKLRLEI